MSLIWNKEIKGKTITKQVCHYRKKYGVDISAIDTIIKLADILFDADFRTGGRNLKQLGLADLTPEEITNL